jgi:hypothetical protein
VLENSPPTVTYSSMTSMKNASIWLFGGITEDNQVQNGLYKLVMLGTQPKWEIIALKNAPAGRFGASLNAVDDYLFLYGGFQSGQSTRTEDLIVLATFDESSIPPLWIRVHNQTTAPNNRLHFASTVLGSKVWIHGGYHWPLQGPSVDARHEFWYLDTLPGLPKGIACPKGFNRAPGSDDPCTDVGRSAAHQCPSGCLLLLCLMPTLISNHDCLVLCRRMCGSHTNQ